MESCSALAIPARLAEDFGSGLPEKKTAKLLLSSRVLQLVPALNASHSRLAELLPGDCVSGAEGRTLQGNTMELNDTNIEVFDQSDCTLAPGELIEHSGIYEICHQDEPRASVILMRNSIFPFCRRCGEMVRYKILELVPHISEDPDFQEVPPEVDNPSYKMEIQTSTFPMQLGRAHGFRFQQDCLQTWTSSSQGGDI
jgi:hypothetical protein